MYKHLPDVGSCQLQTRVQLIISTCTLTPCEDLGVYPFTMFIRHYISDVRGHAGSQTGCWHNVIA